MVKTDRTVAGFGAGVLLKHLNALVQEIDGVRLGEDLEHLHRMRVASRRLRAALPLFGRPVAPKLAKEWEKEVRAITRALGAARDTDVQIEQLSAYLATLAAGPERAGGRRLILRQNQRRTKLQPKVEAALDRFQSSGVIEKMDEKSSAALANRSPDTLSPRLYLLAHRAIQAELSQFLGFEEFIEQPERAEELHAMRIAAKRLRYTIEMFIPLYRADGELKPYLSAVKEAQELLGQLHDCDVWIEQLPAFIEAERRRSVRYFGHERPFKRLIPGLLAFQEDRRQARDVAYERFRQCWVEWRSANLWEQLRETIEAPVRPSKSVLAAPDEVAP